MMREYKQAIECIYNGLTTEGAHHKQEFLQAALMCLLSKKRYKKLSLKAAIEHMAIWDGYEKYGCDGDKKDVKRIANEEPNIQP